MTTTATPTNGLLADNLICEALMIRFPKIYVIKNPQGAEGVLLLAHGLRVYPLQQKFDPFPCCSISSKLWNVVPYVPYELFLNLLSGVKPPVKLYYYRWYDI